MQHNPKPNLTASVIGATYYVAPEDGGQHIEVAYGWSEDGPVRRTIDRASRRVTYQILDGDAFDGDAWMPWSGRGVTDGVRVLRCWEVSL